MKTCPECGAKLEVTKRSESCTSRLCGYVVSGFFLDEKRAKEAEKKERPE